MSPVTKDQWIKVLKAILYSFVSAFIVAITTSQDFSKAGLSAALVSAVNGSLVVVKQLFTQNQ